MRKEEKNPFQYEEVVARVKAHLTIHHLQQQLQDRNERLREANASKEFVERNGGKIWIESAVGRGTSVRFTLPRATKALSSPRN